MTTSYTTHAINGLLKAPDGIFDFGFRERIISGMMEAVKFRLPLNAELVTNPVEVHENLAKAYRLPFPKIVAEYETELKSQRENEPDITSGYKVVTYAEDLGNLKQAMKGFGFNNYQWDTEGYLLYSIVESGAGFWVPSYFAAIVPYDQEGIPALKIGRSKIGMHCFAISQSLAAKVQAAGQGFSHAEMANEMWLDSCAILNIALCSMCENVEHEVVQQPKSLNKSRIKKGKTPFYEYRVLKVKGHEAYSGGGEGKKRSGVRLHMRRGHIRRLNSGGLTWVRHTIVGDKTRGVIMKDYDLS